jgi:DegV family protein with EDD domain
MVTIIADTTCSLPRSLTTQLNIPVLPQMIIFGNEVYRDDNEIDSDTFLKKLRASNTLPKTAAPAPALYYPIYDELRRVKQTGIVITPSSEVSGTFNSATIAAKEYPDVDIRIIDSRTVAGGLGQIVLIAHTMARQEADADTIEETVKDYSRRDRVYFVVDTLEYLQKGGRIGGAQALLGSLLQIKPILCIHDGRIQPVETQRTKSRALKRLEELVVADCPQGNNSHMTISHIENDTEANMLASDFRQALGISEIPIYVIPSAIIVHGGPKVLAVSFFTESKPS